MVTWTKEQLKRVTSRKKVDKITIPTAIQLDKLYKIVNLSPSEAIFIPSEVPSAKNHKAIAYKPVAFQGAKWKHLSKAGRWEYVVPFITDSEFTKKYKKAIAIFYTKEAFRFRNMAIKYEFPIHVEFLFVRRTKARWDFNNITEIVQDMMVSSGWIEDDQVKFLLPHPPYTPPYLINKDIQGVFIKIIGNEKRER